MSKKTKCKFIFDETGKLIEVGGRCKKKDLKKQIESVKKLFEKKRKL